MVTMKGALLFLKLDGMRALVIGSGAVARRKIFKLMNAGVEVTVVSKEKPEFLEGKAKVVVGDGLAYSSSNIDRFDIIVAATGNKVLNAEVAMLARAKGKLVNVVTDPSSCTFFFPAVVDYGDIQIGITTFGDAPLVSKLIKKRIEKAVSCEDLKRLKFDLRVRKLLKDNGFTSSYIKMIVKDLDSNSPNLSNEEIISKAKEIVRKNSDR